MTSVFSFSYLILFLPATVLLYSIVPKGYRWIVLLAASYLFFFLISTFLIAFLLLSTISVYCLGLLIGKIQDQAKQKKEGVSGDERKAIDRKFKTYVHLVLAAGLLLNFGMLAAFKYLVFAGKIATSLLHILGQTGTVSLPSFAAPIGISFYTLIAASYLIDVARSTVEPDRHLGRVALFLCFFPQLIEGPLCRYKETAAQLMEGHNITSSNLYAGSLRILWGVAKKVIVADRLNGFVRYVFENPNTLANPASIDGTLVALGAAAFTLQLYCDFSGAMDVALGAARIFNVKLPENFRQPFFSKTAAEFWQRWHITLGTWFRDYVYYPVSLSKPSKRLTSALRKSLGNRYGPLFASALALLAVWLGNGLWHGAGAQYIFFGLYYFVLILGGSLINPLVQKVTSALHISRDGYPYRLFQMLRTLILVIIGELFFRAKGLTTGLIMFGNLFTNLHPHILTEGKFYTVVFTVSDLVIVLLSMAVILAVGIVKEKNFPLLDSITAKPATLRWALWLGIFFVTVIFGGYGGDYTPLDPIYAKF